MGKVNPRLEDFGVQTKIISFDRGMYTVRPAQDIPENAAQKAFNIVYDKHFLLSNVWGVQYLLGNQYNQFITPPPITSFNWVTIDGDENLIIQGYDVSDGKMSLYKWLYGDNSVTRILGEEDELTTRRRCCYATNKGRLYVTNGVNYLRYYNGAYWRNLHYNKSERFRYITSFNERLWAANSSANPSRLIFSEINRCDFREYYDNNENWIDFVGRDNSQIQWIVPFKDRLLIFKTNSIYALTGYEPASFHYSCISEGVGTISGWSVQVYKDRVYWIWKDRVYMMGDIGLMVSPEDRQVNAEPNIIGISSEIDNYWEENFILPDPGCDLQKVFSPGDIYNNGSTACVSLNTDFEGKNPDVLNAVLTGTETLEQSYITTDTTWVDMKDIEGWYAQSFKLTYNDPFDDLPICSKVSLYLKKTGTPTSSMYLNVYICYDNNGTPDQIKVYAKGRLSLDNVTSTTGGWYDITMSYWDYPQNLFDYNYATPPTKWIVCTVDGVDASNYISWNYSTTPGYANGRMLNSDDSTPTGQENLDYCFKLYCKWFELTVGPGAMWAETPAFNASANYNFDHWGRIYVNLDESRADTTTPGRHTKLIKVLYTLSTDGINWGDYTEIENGGVPETPGSAYCYIKVMAHFYRESCANYKNDSMTLLSIVVNFGTQAELETLIDSCVWEDRYYCSFYSVNGERLPT